MLVGWEMMRIEKEWMKRPMWKVESAAESVLAIHQGYFLVQNHE